MKYINIEMICNGKLTGIKVKLYFRLHFWVDNDTHFRFFSDQWKAPLQPCSQGSLLAVPVERERTGNKVGCLYCCKRKKFSVYVRLIFSLQNGGTRGVKWYVPLTGVFSESLCKLASTVLWFLEGLLIWLTEEEALKASVANAPSQPCAV